MVILCCRLFEKSSSRPPLHYGILVECGCGCGFIGDRREFYDEVDCVAHLGSGVLKQSLISLLVDPIS